MKNTLITFTLLFSLFFFFNGFKNKDFDHFVPFKKLKAIAPDKYFVSKFELTNADYQLFLDDIEATKGKDAIKSLMPEGDNWDNLFTTVSSSGKPYSELYFTHPAFADYPVVNLSKVAIDEYCKWLTGKYNTMEKREHAEVIFRLPTEEEWLIFASPIPGNNLPWHGNKPYKSKGEFDVEYMGNLKIMDYSKGSYNYILDGALRTHKVGQYPPNKIGLYDIIGNVAEYTSDGKIKGGSWYNTIEECGVDLVQSFDVSDPRVGFRLVMEVIKE